MKKVIFILMIAVMLFSFQVYSLPYCENNIPGIIEAENYDSDGKGLSYGDITPGNDGGQYRDDDVDIYNDKTDNYITMEQGEWLKYTFYVDRSGSYEMCINAIIPNLTSKVSVYIDGEIVKEKIGIRSNSKRLFNDISVTVIYIKGGTHTLTIKNDSFDININYIKFNHSENEGLKTWENIEATLSNPVSLIKGSDFGFPVINFQKTSDAAEVVYQNEFYVSQDGDDSNNGNKEKPFKTIQKAVDAVKSVNKNMTGDIKVNIQSGRYRITEPINFDTSDSSTNGYNITYKGEADGSTIIDGGNPVKFEKVEGSPFWSADCERNSYLYEFYVNDHRARVAQSEYQYIPKDAYKDPKTGEAVGQIYDTKFMPLKFDNTEGMVAWGCYEWVPCIAPIKEFKYDSDTATMILGGAVLSESSALVSGNYQTVFMNHISLLDKPGEFYFDKKAQKIYYYPLENEDMSTAIGYVPIVEQLMTVTGKSMDERVEGINFENLSFRHAIWDTPYTNGYVTGQGESYISDHEPTWFSYWGNSNQSVVTVNYATDVNINNCDFENLSASAVHYNNGIENCKIIGNVFYDVGGAAVVLGNGSHCDVAGKAALLPRYTKIENNLIRECGQTLSGSCGIQAYYVNNTSVSNNDLEYLPYTGISVGWGWGNTTADYRDNKICDNKIKNVMHTAWDGSSIYTLSLSEGTVVSGNYFTRTETECGGGCYYPDNGSGMYNVFNNVFENARTWNISWGTNPDGRDIDKLAATITYKNNYVTRLKKLAFRGSAPTEEQLAGFIEVGEGNEWPDKAKNIIKKAGLSGQYKQLLQDFEKRDIPTNMFCYRKRDFVDPKEYVVIEPGRDFLTEGGEGVAFHDHEPENDSDGYENGPDYGCKDWNIGYNGPEDLEWMKFKLKTDKAGDYDVLLGGATMSPGSCRISLDDKVVIDKGLINQTGNWSRIGINNIGKIHLEADKEYILKFEFLSGATNFSHLGFALQSDEDFVTDALYDNIKCKKE